MSKIILITGSTDGIGLETAKLLASQGHQLLLHGRSPAKLEKAQELVRNVAASEQVPGYVADLSDRAAVNALSTEVLREHPKLDVLINNAGVFATSRPLTATGLDLRFVVNTLAPYALTQSFLGALGEGGRVVNLSSAAQAPVSLEALNGRAELSAGEAYAQSKLALTMWSCWMGRSLGSGGPAIIAVNPGSFLGSKMVKEAYGMAGGDLGKGADVLARASLTEEFASATGRYFDNDSGRFASPHGDALDEEKSAQVLNAIKALCGRAQW